jgi:dTDP-4-amino-4,6-dideoxygalactose transaminase
VIRSKKREKLIELLDEKCISWGIHYPNALPFLDPYSYKKHKHEDFAVSGSMTTEILSVPMYPEISEDQLDVICDQLLRYD